MAEVLEDMPEVMCYVKNQNLGFTIPYTLDGEERGYLPDFIVRLRLPSPSGGGAGGEGELLNLILEVSGESRRDKAAKAVTARTLWVPAVNNHGGFGRWAYLEITDPWDAKNTIRAMLGTAETLL
jgi:type III restriction enzyme